MRTQMAYCSACDRQVHIAVTPAPLHGGQATLPDAPQVVCLDFGERCTGRLCPMFGLPRIVMGVRLARSTLRSEPWTTITARCQGCAELTELQVLDESYAFCPLCSTTNRWTRLELENGDSLILTSSDEPGRTA